MTVTWTPQNGGTCEVVNGEWVISGAGTVLGDVATRDSTITITPATGYKIASIVRTTIENGNHSQSTITPPRPYDTYTVTLTEQYDPNPGDGWATYDELFYEYYVEFESADVITLSIKMDLMYVTSQDLFPRVIVNPPSYSGSFAFSSDLNPNVVSTPIQDDPNTTHYISATISGWAKSYCSLSVPEKIRILLEGRVVWATIYTIPIGAGMIPSSISGGVARFDNLFYFSLYESTNKNYNILYLIDEREYTGLILRSSSSGIILRGASGAILRDE